MESILREDTFIGVYTSFVSFIALKYNHCYFNLSSVFLKFHHEVDKLKYFLSKNACLKKFIYKRINIFFKATNCYYTYKEKYNNFNVFS